MYINPPLAFDKLNETGNIDITHFPNKTWLVSLRLKILKQPCPGNVLIPGKSYKSMKTIGALIGKFKDLSTFCRECSMGGVGLSTKGFCSKRYFRYFFLHRSFKHLMDKQWFHWPVTFCCWKIFFII